VRERWTRRMGLSATKPIALTSVLALLQLTIARRRGRT
jgi:hypothetical protein